MVVMPLTRCREKMSVVMFILLVLLIFIYFYLYHLQESFKSAQWSGERCISELSSVKYQLSVVTEYKNRIDKLLSESQKAHESDKEKFKDIMDSCVAMRQQSSICQNQFEDLQTECKKVREELTSLTKEVEKFKTGG